MVGLIDRCGSNGGNFGTFEAAGVVGVAGDAMAARAIVLLCRILKSFFGGDLGVFCVGCGVAMGM